MNSIERLIRMLAVAPLIWVMPTANGADMTLVPRIDGEWWQVAHQPDLGALSTDRQEPVDFGVWQAADGTWQLWSCIRKTKETGTGRLFFGWEGAALTDGDWTPTGIQMRANTAVDEVDGGLQAPYVRRIDGRYHMFYGSWKAICLALSDGGRTFQREIGVDGKVGLFGGPEADNRRDAMVIRHRGLWYCYYTAHPGGVGRVLCRTSPDLREWSGEHLVRMGGEAGDKLWSHECPHVVEMGGWFYLFTTQRYQTNPRTSVFRSRDPLSFGVDNDDLRVGFLPVAAPEIIRYNDEFYIAALMPELDGIRIARLKWEAADH